jgi:hypothetical protein
MGKWHTYRRRLIRRTLRAPEPLFVFEGEEIRTAVLDSWR